MPAFSNLRPNFVEEIMRKPAAYLFAILVGAIIWFFFQHFDIVGMQAVRFVPKEQEKGDGELQSDLTNTLEVDVEFTDANLQDSGNTAPTSAASLEVVPSVSRQSIRIASFHLNYFGSSSADKAHVLDIVARVVRRFDIVALQGISPRGSTIVAELNDLANQTGRKYDHIVGASTADQDDDMQFAFLFDRETIMADRNELYTLGDPQNLLRRDPLVGWFRTRKPAAERAFTFTLVNVHTERRRHLQELNVLHDVLYAIRDDGRQEDDVILLGCFHADDRQLGKLGRVPGIVSAIRSVPTNIEGTLQTENIVFRKPATDEFTGRSGVFDVLRNYNLSVARAREVSDFMPVWAEFSVFEGGDRGRVANEPNRRY